MTLLDTVDDLDTVTSCLDVLTTLLDPGASLQAQDRANLALLIGLLLDRQRAATEAVMAAAGREHPPAGRVVAA